MSMVIVVSGVFAAGAAAVGVLAAKKPETVEQNPAAVVAAVQRTSGLSYVVSDTNERGQVLNPALRSCGYVLPEGVANNQCAPFHRMDHGTHVQMRCWDDIAAPEKDKSHKWFYVTEAEGLYKDWNGWVHSDLVKDQIEVPRCSNQILDQYPLGDPHPTPVPDLKLTITGSCTTAGGSLGATSANFTPGRPYGVSATYPDGQLYPLAKTEGTVSAAGEISWSWPCAGDPAGTYTTEVVDYGTGRTVRASFAIAEPKKPVTSSRPNGGISTPTPTPPSPTGNPIREVSGTVHGCNTYGQNCDNDPLYAQVPPEGYDWKTWAKNATVPNGSKLVAHCWAQGGLTTNYALADRGPDPYDSDIYYNVSTPDGSRHGFMPDTYFVRDKAGRLGLPSC